MSKQLVKAKFCWVSRQVKPDAWRLSLNIGDSKFPIKGLLFASPKDVEKALKGGVVFVHLKSEAKKVVAKKAVKKGKK